MLNSKGQSGTPLLEVCDLSLNFRDQRNGEQIAIDRVSFKIDAGSTLGLIGASGSGKSSIARCIMQLLRPEKGKILFNGEDMSTMTARQLMTTRQRLQIVFQEPSASLSPRRNISQILLEPLQHFSIGEPGQRLQKVKQTLQTVGLDADVLHRYPQQFSTGQQQRIAIARALVTDPDMLIADEAVSSLDVSVQAQILKLIQSLQQAQGITFLFISHDLGVIRQIADHVAVMYQGQLLEQAPADTFFSQPSHPYSKALLAFARSDNSDHVPVGHWHLEHGRNTTGHATSCLYAGKCAEKMQVCENSAPDNHNFRNNEATHCVKCHLYGEAGNNDN